MSSVLLSPSLVLANATIWLDRLRPRLTTDPRRGPWNSPQDQKPARR
jgi:hypothetical protein